MFLDMIPISNRAKSIEPSKTLEIIAKVSLLRSQGIRIYDFGAGEPDFETPDVIKQEAINAITPIRIISKPLLILRSPVILVLKTPTINSIEKEIIEDSISDVNPRLKK